mmetsp:Transcript_22640/g.71078  ORF Transcript_22640/g.71078 Transcript_22640/m.71078 type:complete len:260 (+) Transcript_22640:376-1155(+)
MNGATPPSSTSAMRPAESASALPSSPPAAATAGPTTSRHRSSGTRSRAASRAACRKSSASRRDRCVPSSHRPANSGWSMSSSGACVSLRASSRAADRARVRPLASLTRSSRTLPCATSPSSALFSRAHCLSMRRQERSSCPDMKSSSAPHPPGSTAAAPSASPSPSASPPPAAAPLVTLAAAPAVDLPAAAALRPLRRPEGGASPSSSPSAPLASAPLASPSRLQPSCAPRPPRPPLPPPPRPPFFAPVVPMMRARTSA